MAIYQKGSRAAASLTVPVWVDEFRTVQDVPLVRLAYFAAESMVPAEDARLPLEEVEVPVIATGLTAAICQPNERDRTFGSHEEIVRCFDRIEEGGSLSVETPDFWLPLEAFDATDRPVAHGDVFRISMEMFSAGLRFRTGRSTMAEFLAEAGRVPAHPEYSPDETQAFAAWGEHEVERAREAYKALKQQDRILKDIERKDEGRVFEPRVRSEDRS